MKYEFISACQELTKLYRGHDKAIRRKIVNFNKSDWGANYLRTAYKKYYSSGAINLLPKKEISEKYTETLINRRSTREFTGESIGFQNISDLLSHSLMSNDKNEYPRKRPYPAAGEIYSIEHYVVFLNVEGYSPQILHYCRADNTLTKIVDILDLNDLSEALNFRTIEEKNILKTTGIIIVQTAIVERIMNKYSERGYLFSMIENGMSVQTLMLTASAMKYGSLMWGGYYDNELSQILEIDGTREVIAAILFIGKT